MIFPLTRRALRGIRKFHESPAASQQILARFLRMKHQTTKRTLRIISLHQPYASAMAFGLKLNETRHWGTDYRGPIAIHAATTKEYIREWGASQGGIWKEIQRLFAKNGIKTMADFPLGKVLGVTELYGCVPTERLLASTHVPEIEHELGGYDEGRFAWLTRNFQRLTVPVPEIGRKRWWKWEAPPEINLEAFTLV